MNIPFTKLQRRADNSDCSPCIERLSHISLLGRTALRKTIPVWLVLLSIVLVQNAGGYTLNSAKGLKVYPTVVNDVVNIAYTGSSKISAVYISDIVGRQVKRCLYLSSAIDLSDIPNGIYFLNVVFDDNSIESTKIIINR